METNDDQQFCLRWNNFQANITSQFETLRDDEDFTDVTIACDGQKIQAHKVVLSACSPFFKELFKTNPCRHPIIFMRDVEAQHIMALMEFMYAGEVNVAQANLSTFLKTAESLKIRGLTDTNDTPKDDDDNDGLLYMNSQTKSTTNPTISSDVTSSQDISINNQTSPPPKRPCKFQHNLTKNQHTTTNEELAAKLELPDYLSDNDDDDNNIESPVDMEIIPSGSKENGQDLTPMQSNDTKKLHSLDPRPCEECGRIYSNLSNLRQHMKLIHYPTYVKCPICDKSFKTDLYLRRHITSSHDNVYTKNRNALITFNTLQDKNLMRLKRRRHSSSDQWLSYDQDDTELSSRLIENDPNKKNKLIKIGEGIEIFEDQLRSVKWNDYRKLTRGLATILFSPAELATCSVTGQRWSRAGSGERPVKPALDRTKVQAIISYVATKFPMIEISRIKQVLAYKCKENSTALKIKALRYFEDQHSK